MKSSHQTLMLGILMGLVAWVMDALISWHFFPGKSFYEMLFNYDPARTLYVRSTVVILFFIFGMMAGKLLTDAEEATLRLQRNVKLLDGIRDIHEEIVKLTRVDALVAALLPLIKNTFELEELRYFSLEDAALRLGKELPASGDVDDECLRSEIEQHLGVLREQTTSAILPCGKTDTTFLTPVCLGNRVFGVLVGKCHGENSAFAESELSPHFLAVCNDLGYAMAHISDHCELNENAEKLTHLYETAPVGIFTTTVNGMLRFANPALANILGAESAEMLLKSDQPVTRFYADPYRRDEFIRLLKRDGCVIDFESEFVTLKGERRILLLAARLSPAPEAEGDALIDGFVMDMTGSRNAERENRILQQELSESQHFKSITVLAGGVAHEFNNILQAMMGSAYLAQMKITKTDQDIWQYLQDIQESGKRAARLCDQMLSYAGKKAILLKLEKPDACVENILKIVMANADPKTKFEKKLNAPGASVRMDIPSFSEVINQLVSNAVESFDKSEGLIRIQSEIQAVTEKDLNAYQLFRPIPADDYWILSVTDNGSGIKKEDLAHIFQPFFTTKFQGRGLGLPSVGGLLEKYDGSMGVRSTPSQGTEFRIWLPLAQSVLVEEPDPSASAAETTDFKVDGKIWVVDDEPLICMTIERLLTRSGLKVGTAHDGLDALEKIRQEDPAGIACLILDVTMPKMGGLQTLERLREFLPQVPVLIMSGYDESDSLEAFKDLDVTGFIHKPFRMEQLETRLKKILT